MEKPEALFLADELEAPLGTVIGAELYRRAAKELRRLHAENAAIAAALASSCDEQRHELWESGGVAGCERARVVERQRDALLEALNAMLTHMGMDEDEWNKPTFDKARAALAQQQAGSWQDGVLEGHLRERERWLAQQEEPPTNQCGETCERAKLCAACARALEEPTGKQDLQVEPAQEPVAVVGTQVDVWRGCDGTRAADAIRARGNT